MANLDRVSEIIGSDEKDAEGFRKHKGWLVIQQMENRAKKEEDAARREGRPKNVYPFEEMTEEGTNTNSFILAVAQGDIQKYYWIEENLSWLQLFEFYYLDKAWRWEPLDKKAKS